MKRLNLKLVVSLLMITVTAVVGGYIAHGFQYGAAVENSRKDGDALLKEGKRAEALRQYMVYIRQKGATADPQVLVETAKLANSLEFEQPNRDNGQQAVEAHRIAMRQLPDNADLRRSYAELMMFGGQFHEAIDPLLWLTAPERGKHDAKLDIMLAECYIQRSFYDKAVEVCSTMIGLDPKTRTFDPTKAQAPDQIDAYEILARLLRERVQPQQPKVADAVMDRLTVVNKDSYRAHLQRARYLQQYAKGVGSETDLEVALKLAPNDPDVILIAAQAALIDSKFADCPTLLTRGLKLYPKNVAMYRQWAVLKSTENKLNEAVDEVQKGLKLLPGNPDMLWILCEVELKHDLPAAREALAQLSKTNYKKPLVDLMEARILLFEGKWREAALMFERLRPLLAQSAEHTKQIDIYSAQCYSQLGEYDKVLDASRRVLQFDPTSISAQVAIAGALMATGKTEEAHRAYENLARAIGKNRAMSTPQIWRPIVQLRMDEQMRKPKDKRDWSGVDAIINLLDADDAVDSKHPDMAAQSAIVLMKAEIELRKGNEKQARKLLLDAKAKYPLEPSVWSALATITYRTDNAAAALKILGEAPAEIRDSVLLRLNHAGILLRKGGDNVKQSIVALDANSDKLAPADQGRLWSGLGAALLSIGDQTGAEHYWSKATDVSPDDLKIRFSLLDLSREIGDDAVMSKMVGQFRTIMGAEKCRSSVCRSGPLRGLGPQGGSRPHSHRPASRAFG